MDKNIHPPTCMLPVNTREQKEKYLFCLYFKCPHTQDNPKTCIFHHLRHLSFHQYKLHIQKLSDEQIDHLFNTHLEYGNKK